MWLLMPWPVSLPMWFGRQGMCWMRRTHSLSLAPPAAQPLSPHWFARHTFRSPRRRSHRTGSRATRSACRVVPPAAAFRQALPSRAVPSSSASSSPHRVDGNRRRVRPSCGVSVLCPLRSSISPVFSALGRGLGAEGGLGRALLSWQVAWRGRSEARERQARLERAVGRSAWAVENS